MSALDDRVISEYLRRSYLAVDGLWFLAVEKEHSYEDALRLDEEVWEVLPKIQARKAKELLGLKGACFGDLSKALQLKFVAEGSTCRIVEQTPNLLAIEIAVCAWLETLKKSGRTNIAQDICQRICLRELSVWAREFLEGIEVSFPAMMSSGEENCKVLFQAKKNE